jgi:hypothetical protein
MWLEKNKLKGEYKVISSRVNDLAWDGESKRIIAVGDGKEKLGSAMLFLSIRVLRPERFWDIQR